jgi:hypothetical protein
MRRAEGGAKIVGVFRVKNHDFTPKNHIFSNTASHYEFKNGASLRGHYGQNQNGVHF